MMDQEFRKRWTAALRSGDYVQGPGALTILDGDGNFRYCCLGVACALLVEDGVIERMYDVPTKQIEYWSQTKSGRHEVDRAALPTAAIEHIGFQQYGNLGELPSNPGTGVLRNLATVNDDGNNSFVDIADLIDKHYGTEEEVPA